MIKDHDYFRKAKLIKDVRDNPLWPFVQAEILADIGREILDTPPNDPQARELLYAESKALNRVFGRLMNIANDVTSGA